MYYYNYGSAASKLSSLSTAFTIVSIIVIIILIGLTIAFANTMQDIAESKGHKKRYWAWCFWLPVLGGFMVAALPDLKARDNYDEFDSDELPVISSGAATKDSPDNELPEL